MIKMGIIGVGRIANTMAKTIREMDQVESYAVASRELSRAQIFANEYGFTKAYGSYEEMLNDPELDLVYIATPHSHHHEHMMLCLNHGKHVLCEKSFTINEGQAREVLELATSKGLLVAEAIWTRYLPMRAKLDEILASGVIGKPHMLTANLGYLISHKDRITDPHLAGGALLDVGVYPLNFASMVFGNDIQTITSTAVISEQGVDLQNSTTLIYQDVAQRDLNHHAVDG